MKVKIKKTMECCPVCLNGRFVNRLSKDSFFCASCLNEFKVMGKKVYLMEINEVNGDAKPVVVS
jgi:hypothetical protein